MRPAIQDNEALRALFTLPPIQPSASTALTVPEMPTQKRVTGDKEVDAVLWLREVISTGNQNLIDKAFEAAAHIKTPLKELGKRYTALVSRASGGHFGAVLMTFGFDDLKGLAKTSVEKSQRKHEALSRFGTEAELFCKTPAEKACEKAFRGVKKKDSGHGWREYVQEEADARFAKHPDLVPHTLADVLHVQAYGSALYWLRQAACDNAGDHWPAFQEHDDYTFRMLARIPPRDAAEALAVFEWINDGDKMDRTETNDILRNLISGGWQ